MTATNLTATIDRLGIVNAQIAKLEAEASTLKAVMVEVGPGKYEGETYAITVVKGSTREGHDDAMKAKVKELIATHLSTQYVTAHTIFTQVKPSVRVSVRKDVEVAA